MRLSRFSSAMLLLLGIVAAGFGEEKKENRVDCKYFSICLPKDFKLDAKSPVEDFEIIRISKGEIVCLGIYVGNHPNYPSIKKEGKHEIAESKLGNVETISEWKGDKLLRKELKIRSPDDKGWPQYLHVFYGDDEGNTVMVAERIVVSLKLNDGKNK